MKNFLVAIKFLFISFSLVGIYTLVITISTGYLFPFQSGGSVLQANDGKLLGSELLAQKFIKPKYFWSRPSASDYQTLPSFGSNLALGSDALNEQIQKRKNLLGAKQACCADLPQDLLTTSGSGLDPHISLEAALFQVSRIVQSRNFNAQQKLELVHLIDRSIEQRRWGFLGEPRINVLKLNIALDKLDELRK